MNTKKIISVILALVMVLSAIPMMSYAADKPIQCYVDGVPTTENLRNVLQNATDGQVITLAETYTNWPVYFEPDSIGEGETVTVDLNGMTINRQIDVWPNVTVKGTLIIKNGTVIAPEEKSAVHVGTNIKHVYLYDMEVYGQLDGNEYSDDKAKVPALSVYSGNYYAGNRDPYYNYNTPNYIYVYGGTWNYDASGFIGKNSEWIDNGDGTYTAQPYSGVNLETDESGNYLINNFEDFDDFRRSVDAGVSYKGKKILLTSDIDLSGINWNPIGSAYMPFEGDFDGQNHTVSNLYVQKNVNDIGLFSFARNGSIKNLKIHNATVLGDTSTRKGAAALIGRGYTGFAIENISVTGKIHVEIGCYVGGISGNYTYSRIENCHVDGTNEDGFESIIYGTLKHPTPGYGYTNYVGGICGEPAEDSGGIYKCTVTNITLKAEGYGVGGIAGVLMYNTTISDCHVYNVVFRSPVDDDAIGWTGFIVGKANYKSSKTPSKVINCTGSYDAYIHDSVESVELYAIGDDYSRTDGTAEKNLPSIIIGNNVTYDSNGKYTGGDFTIINMTQTQLEKFISPESISCLIKDENGNYVLNHTLEDFIYNNDATCMNGTETAICEVCGATVTREAEGTATGIHTFTEYVYNNDAICVEDGTKTAVCDVCKVATDSKVAEGTATGIHEFVTYYSNNDAECIKNGTETATCVLCHIATQTRDEVGSATNIHVYSDYQPNGDATCIANGTKTAICDQCGVATDTVEDEGSMTPDVHVFLPEAYEYNNDATCIANGTETAVCDICHAAENTREKAGTMTPDVHVFTSYIFDNNAICVKDGTQTAICDVCGVAKHTIPKTGTATGVHVYTNYVYNNDATCVEDGTETAKCDQCGIATYTRKAEGTATGIHTYTEYKYNEDSNCISNGTQTAVCDVCHKFTNTIEAPGTLDKKVHKFTIYKYNDDATCYQDGSETATCDWCHSVIDTRRTPGTMTNNHTFTRYRYNGNATCVKDGTESAKCDVCNEKIDYRVAPGTATGIHSFTNYRYNNDATCTENGTKTAVCDMCKEATDTIEAEKTAKGHADFNGDKICDDCGEKYVGNGDGKVCKWCQVEAKYSKTIVIGVFVKVVHSIIHAFTAKESIF